MLLLLAAILAVVFVLDRLLTPQRFSNEPPVVSHSIPYIGHILGLLRHGSKYYQITSTKCKLPIYTLNMLQGKVYVVTSPDLITALNRNTKAIAFNPFIAQIGKRITGHDEATGQIVQHNLNGEQGPGYVIDVHDGIVAALAPGRTLENTIKPFLEEASTNFDALVKDNEVDLFAWMRQMVTLCSTRAIYGPENPFNKNTKCSDSFWQFDHNLNVLILDVAPGILAPKGNRARSELADAFQHYFENYVPDQTQSSAMIRARYSAATKYGVSPSNQGRLEVGTLLGILANTIPSSFYMIVHIYSDPALLQDIRDELEAMSVLNVPGETKRSLCVITMREKCQLLHSTFQELLRLHAQGSGARFVREDTLLDGQYLLKKGMVVQMPMAVMHSDPSIWGPDAQEFQPRRFLKQNAVGNESKAALTVYRPFGGGASKCPGRHFATLEILALTAYMILRFDIVPSRGEWSIPEPKQESLATNVFPPKKDLKVRIIPRQGSEEVRWDFFMK